jgi:hypothetical protein
LVIFISASRTARRDEASPAQPAPLGVGRTALTGNCREARLVLDAAHCVSAVTLTPEIDKAGIAKSRRSV